MSQVHETAPFGLFLVLAPQSSPSSAVSPRTKAQGSSVDWACPYMYQMWPGGDLAWMPDTHPGSKKPRSGWVEISELPIHTYIICIILEMGLRPKHKICFCICCTHGPRGILFKVVWFIVF